MLLYFKRPLNFMKSKKIYIVLLLILSLNLNLAVAFANPTDNNPASDPIQCEEEFFHESESTEDDAPLEELPEIDAEGAILIDADTGKVLYEHNIDDEFYPASTTKILTALLAIENGDMEDIVTVSNEANLVHRDGSIAGLDLNEEISLEKLIYGLMLPSGNDAAYTIAVYVARKVTGNPDMPMEEAIDYFSDMMNKRAQTAGAKNSHFSNPHGYHSDDHFTTPYDIAMIAREAMRYEFFRDVVSTRMYTMEDWNGFDKDDPTKKEIRYWRNTNLLIDENSTKFYYPYATGIKTGYTSPAGQCLVSSAEKDSLNLIAVAFKTSKEGKWLDSIELLEYGFENFISHKLVGEGDLLASTSVLNNGIDNGQTIGLIAKEGHSEVIKKQDIDKIQKRIIIQPYIQAPVEKGQLVGRVSYKLDGETLFQTDLIANKSIKEKALLDISNVNRTIGTSKVSFISRNTDTIIVFGILALFFIILFSGTRKKKKNYHTYHRGK